MDKNSIEFLTDIISELPKAYQKEETKPKGFFLPEIYNFVGFLALFVKDLSGINSIHVFLIHKLENRKIKLKAKK